MNNHRCLTGLAVLLLLVLLLPWGCGTEKEYAAGLVDGYDRAKATGTAGDMQAIGRALSSYQMDNGSYPAVASIEALASELSPNYLRLASTNDKWGNPYSYSLRGAGYRLVSKGEDGREGTEDDLVLEDGRLTQTPPGFGPKF